MALTQEERNMQIEFIHNVYKSTHGHRPRHLDLDSMTDAELDETADIVSEDAKALTDDDKENEGEAYDRGVKADARFHRHMNGGWTW